MNRALSWSSLLLLPLAVFSPAGETVLLLLSALAAAAALWRGAAGQGAVVAALTAPAWLRILYGIAALGAVSALWAIHPADALGLAVSLAVLFAAAAMVFALAGRITGDAREWFLRWSWVGFAAGAALLAIELLANFPIRIRVTGIPATGPGSPHPGLLGAALTVMTLLIWPLAASAWNVARGNAVPAIFAVAALVAVGGNLAAAVALAAGAAVFVAARFGGRPVVHGITALAVAFVAAAPLLATLPDPDEIAGRFSEQSRSALHRLYIWEFTAARIAEKPLTGWGLDSSRAIPDADRPVLPSGPVLSLHPHNAALQVWLELGLAGALLLAAFLWRIGRAIANVADPLARAGTAAAFASALVVAFLSFGIWQNWWIASLALAAAFARAAIPRPPFPSDGSP